MQKTINIGHKTAFFVASVTLLSCFEAQSAFSQTVSGGMFHSLIVCNDGTVETTGYFIGADSSMIITTPMQIDGLTGIVAAAAGSFYSLALKNDGTIWV